MRNDDNPAETKHVMRVLPQPLEPPAFPTTTRSNNPATFAFRISGQHQTTQPVGKELLFHSSIWVDPNLLQNGCLLSTAQEWYHEGGMESNRAARVALQERDRRQDRIGTFVSVPLEILFFLFVVAVGKY